jgi:16S rRNA G966 N2-methylase RsmD
MESAAVTATATATAATAPWTPARKAEVAHIIKPITLAQAEDEFRQLVALGPAAGTKGPRCRLGNNVVDFFTFAQRLETRGKYNVNYYEFVDQLDTVFKQKVFVANMLNYYETVKNKSGRKNPYVVYKEVFNICVSAINIIRPLVYMELYTRFRPQRRVLDFCAGWGGASVAAAALGVPYVGIEINTALRAPYAALLAFLQERVAPTFDVDVRFEDATETDYAALDYDVVFTSPPYYFIQRYQGNVPYVSKDDMDARFYRPVFTRTYAHLCPGGTYALNVNREVYERVARPCLGEADEMFAFGKSQRQNAYQEQVYVWRKPGVA